MLAKTKMIPLQKKQTLIKQELTFVITLNISDKKAQHGSMV